MLEGSTRRVANRIRVTAQLIDALTGNHIWAERYDRVLVDMLALQEELTQAIVAAVAPQVENFEMSRVCALPPGHLSAYQLAYAEGMLDGPLSEFGGHHSGGAKLLFVKKGVRGKLYREGVQAPLGAEQLDAFRQTILAAVTTMSQSTFPGSRVIDPWGRGDTARRALHRVRAVSSD